MSMNQPRLRAMLREADKVAANGKRSAAKELYEEILAEVPDAADAWAGLAEVTIGDVAQEEAFNKALELDENNRRALIGLAQLRGEEIDLPEPEPEPEPKLPAQTPEPVDETAYDLVCYRHPNKETSLRCYTCGKPICIDCAKKTAVGYACPDCIRELEDKYFNSQTSDYIVAPIVAFILGLIGGVILTLLGSFGGLFLWFILAAAGGAVGSFIGGIIKRAIGRRRGRYLPIVVAVVTIVATILPSILVGLGFNLIVLGIYLFFAIPAIYYQMR